jgi:hypothetical protein
MLLQATGQRRILVWGHTELIKRLKIRIHSSVVSKVWNLIFYHPLQRP